MQDTERRDIQRILYLYFVYIYLVYLYFYMEYVLWTARMGEKEHLSHMVLGKGQLLGLNISFYNLMSPKLNSGHEVWR